MAITDDYAADKSTAGILTPGTSTTPGATYGRFERPGDFDWFKFHAVAGFHYEFWAEGPGLGLDHPSPYVFPTSYSIIDADGSYLQTYGSFDAEFSGYYYVAVYGLQTGDYKLLSSTWSDDFSRYDNTLGRIAPGGQVSGHIDYRQDIDRIKVTLESGKFYSFWVTGEYNYFSVNLYDGNDKTLAYNTANIQGKGLELQVHPALSADYYLDVQHYSPYWPQPTTLPYTVKLTSGIADDFGDTTAAASPLAIGASVTGTAQASTDVDMFKVTLQAGTSYAFILLAPNAANSGLGLANYGMSGQQTRPVLVEDSGSAAVIALTAAVSGDYYLAVDGAYGQWNYTLKTQQLSGDITAPTLLSTTHTPDEKNVALTDNTMTLVFSEAVKIKSSDIQLKDAAGKQVVLDYHPGFGNSAMVNDNVLTIKTQSSLAPGTYTIVLPRSALTDLAGNPYAGPESIRFTTILPVKVDTGGNDLFSGGTGSYIDGGAGIDTAYYAAYSSNFSIKRIGTDVVVRNHNGTSDTLQNIERVQMASEFRAMDIDGNGGQAYRLYQAALHRSPDYAGLGYWIAQMDNGASVRQLASGFLASAEFKQLYGAETNDADLLKLLYNNVLNRAPDAEGYNYWQAALSGGLAREDLLVNFSESAENKAALIGVIGDGFSYTPYLATH